MEFIPGYRAANAPKRAKVRDASEAPKPAATPGQSDAAHRAAPDPSGAAESHDAHAPGNGNGGRRLAADAKPFDYEGDAPSSSSPATPHSPPPTSALRLALIADPISQHSSNLQADAPACDVCGSITVRSGTCYKCLNCGNSMGCS
jgi:ribonucleoside-diphosphate reductase alpha chain